MFSQLIKSAYKKVVRSAQIYDKIPILKGMISQQSFESFYSEVNNGNEKELAYCQNLLDEFLDHNVYYTYDKNLSSFIQKKAHGSGEYKEEKDYLSVLMRINEYLQSQINSYERDRAIGKSNQTVLPVSRDLRELFDRVKPTLISSPQSDYSGCLLLQNPSLPLHLHLYKTDQSTLSSHLSTLVMFPLFSIQSSYQILFLSDSSPHSSTSVLLKQHFIQSAYQLRNETPSVTISGPSPGKQPANQTHRKRSMFESELAETPAIPQMKEVDNAESPIWKNVFEREICTHPILGEGMSYPLVVFDDTGVSRVELDAMDYVKRLPHVCVSHEYERIVRALKASQPECASIPLCLACVSNTISYPF